MTSKQRKITGRPIKTAKPGEPAALGMRISAELKNQIDEAAKANNRTQSQEAERRLERSFDSKSIMEDFISLRRADKSFAIDDPEIISLLGDLFGRNEGKIGYELMNILMILRIMRSGPAKMMVGPSSQEIATVTTKLSISSRLIKGFKAAIKEIEAEAKIIEDDGYQQ